MEQRPKKLLDRVRETIRRKHYSIRTEKSYVAWIRQYIFFNNPVVSCEPVKRSNLKCHKLGIQLLPTS